MSATKRQTDFGEAAFAMGDSISAARVRWHDVEAVPRFDQRRLRMLFEIDRQNLPLGRHRDVEG